VALPRTVYIELQQILIINHLKFSIFFLVSDDSFSVLRVDSVMFNNNVKSKINDENDDLLNVDSVDKILKNNIY